MNLENLYTFNSLFSQWRFHVPDYQRGYAWGESQWQDLLDDLATLTDDNDHFTGLLVLHENKDPSLRLKARGIVEDVFDIVDGQQRLTTIVILLNEIRREMKQSDKEDLIEIANSIQDKYLYKPGQGNITVMKLVLDGYNHDFFVHNIIEVDGKDIRGAEIQSHKNLVGAQTYFRQYLQKNREEKGEHYPAWLESLYSKISTQMKVMVYLLRSEADAGVVFESMNNRGKKPNQLDLVKNYLLYLASKLGTDMNARLTEEIKTTWETLFKQLSTAGRQDDEEVLLQMHWITIYDHDPKHWDQEKEKSDLIKRRFALLEYLDRYEQLFQELLDYVITLRNAAVAYCDLRNPLGGNSFQIFAYDASCRREIIRWSQKLVRQNVFRPFIPLLLAVRLKYPEDASKYLEMVRLCEKYLFRVFRVAGKRTNSKDSVLFRLGNQLYHGRMTYETANENMRRSLLYECPTRTFEASFSVDNPMPWYGKQGLSYFLYEYEEHLYGDENQLVRWEAVAKGGEKTIEHILPQNPEEGGYWTERFTLEDRQRLTHQIGNLVLTVDNSALGRKPFPEKKGYLGSPERCYANSDLRSEREIAAVDDWTPEEIVKRQAHLRDWALERWFVESPPPVPDDAFEALKRRAELNGFGDAFMQIDSIARRLGLPRKANKNRMAYKSPRNFRWSVFKVYTYASGIEFSINYWALPSYQGVTTERIRDILDHRDSWWLPPNQVPGFLERLEQLANEVESLKGK